jgi:hypothetical protein
MLLDNWEKLGGIVAGGTEASFPVEQGHGTGNRCDGADEDGEAGHRAGQEADKRQQAVQERPRVAGQKFVAGKDNRARKLNLSSRLLARR